MQLNNLVVWHVANGTPRALDGLVTDTSGVLRGVYSRQTVEALQQTYPGARVTDIQTFSDEEEKAYRTLPVEITEEDYYDALEALPPVGLHYGEGFETFKMMEAISGRMTTIYARQGSRCWCFVDRDDTPHSVIVERILATTPSHPQPVAA